MTFRRAPDPRIHRLATALVASLGAAMPPGAEARVEPDDSISLSFGEHGTTVAFGPLASDHWEGSVENAVWQVLSAAQDVVSETLAEPWPASAAGELALPEVRVRDGAVVAWFGPEDKPVLVLDPLPLPGS